MFVGENFVGFGEENDTAVQAKVYCRQKKVISMIKSLHTDLVADLLLLTSNWTERWKYQVYTTQYTCKYYNHIIISFQCSDEQSVSKVVPKYFQNNQDLLTQIITVSYVLTHAV